jgi:hypothetical protein
MRKSRITRWLENAPAPAFTAYAVVAAFATYFCMYAFRRPFAVGTYPGAWGSLDLKTVYLISQVVGYAASKFLGIKVVSELPAGRRALGILACIGIAEAALALFAIVPAPWCAIFLLANGLPLGMVWGLVFGFLEGRRVSDLLGAGLSASFIVASGFVKTVGKLVLGWGVPEYWMPATTGALFFPALLLFVWLLSRIPPPTAQDEAERVRRAPMDRDARRKFLGRYLAGIAWLTVGYMLLTAYRDYRDSFAREIWDALGYAKEPSIMTTAEIPVALGALLAVGAMMGIRDSRKALAAIHGVMIAGAALVGGGTLLYRVGALSPAAWMITVGLGLYVGYVPFNCVLFDRLIAAVGSVATAGFLIYVADAFGYLGSVGVLLYRSFLRTKTANIEFFVQLSYAVALTCTACFAVSMVYFARRTRALR